MTAIYTFDVFSSLDGFGGVSDGRWGEQAPNCWIAGWPAGRDRGERRRR